MLKQILTYYIPKALLCSLEDAFTCIILLDYHKGSVRSGSKDTIHLCCLKGKATEAEMC